jgi:hypothetical protein
MQSVINVLQNRVKARGTDIYTEATRRKQFSSMTAYGDPNLPLYPAPGDEQWAQALTLMYQAKTGALDDITGGATNYYALSLGTPPYWAASMTKTVIIEGQVFFR